MPKGLQSNSGFIALMTSASEFSFDFFRYRHSYPELRILLVDSSLRVRADSLLDVIWRLSGY